MHAHRHDLTVAFASENATVFAVVERRDHPLYNESVSYGDDVGMWRLAHVAGPVFTAPFPALDTGEWSRPGLNMTVSGWGASLDDW